MSFGQSVGWSGAGGLAWLVGGYVDVLCLCCVPVSCVVSHYVVGLSVGAGLATNRGWLGEYLGLTVIVRCAYSGAVVVGWAGLASGWLGLS